MGESDEGDARVDVKKGNLILYFTRKKKKK